MAFTKAAGYTNLPNGNFSPTIFSKKAQIAFRKTSVVQAITNSDYFGEISAFGDTVRIIMEPDVTVRDYERGGKLIREDLTDDELTLTVDQAKYFNFAIDDIEDKQSHVDWEGMASNRAAYKLRDGFDSNVLTYMTANVASANIIGTSGTPQVISHTVAGSNMTPLQVMNRVKLMMALANVPNEDRYFVADPYFYELLEDENSKLLSRDYAQGDILRNGKVTSGTVRGFTLYESNNLPSVGTGVTGSGSGNYGWILAGHKSAVATAEQINKTEKYRPDDTFADAVKGLHLFGRKLLRSESLYAVRWNRG
jgi:hypothetical protein